MGMTTNTPNDMRTLTATLTEHDAWGQPRTVTVDWIPEDITADVDPARLNRRRPDRLIAHGTPEDPPVYLRRSTTTGSVGLFRVVRAHTAERERVTEFMRVHTPEELVPGSFFVASDSDA